MPCFHRHHTLASPRVHLTVVRCDGDDGAGARPEAWEDDHVLVVLGGRFAFRDRRRTTALAPLSVLAVRGGEPILGLPRVSRCRDRRARWAPAMRLRAGRSAR